MICYKNFTSETRTEEKRGKKVIKYVLGFPLTVFNRCG